MTATAPATSAPFASASLYVGDLAADVTEALLFEIFNAVGPVASVRVCRDAATRRSLGYAYVNFHRVDDAERALDTMNFSAIKGVPCRIMWSHRDPSLRKSGAGNIFVKNLAKSIDNKSLYDTFSMFGNILSCKVATNAKKESLGYGFVHYESEDSAKNAIERVNGMVIAGQKVTVSPFKSKKERGSGDKTQFTNIYVKFLPTEYSLEKLEGLFSPFGTITSSHLATDEEGKSRGFGFINFEEPESARKAVDELNGKMFETSEKELFVARAQKKEERSKALREKFEQLKAERQKKYAGVNCYVKNLGDDVNDAKLREEFSKFGNITSARVMIDEAGKSKGFGFVCFGAPEEATKAVTEMNGKMIDGKPLYVALAQRKEVRRQQLEQQYASRQKMGVPQPQMFPPQVSPMFYQGMPRQNYVYPPQMVHRGWNPAQARPVPMAGVRGTHVQYNLMPMPNGRPAGQPQQGQRNNNRNQRRKNQPQQGSQPQQNRPRQQGGPIAGGQGATMQQPALTIESLAAASKEQQKQMIGERLFPLIQHQEPALAGKITGMLLEMDNGELLHLLESEAALSEKIQEALQVLQQHDQLQAEAQKGQEATATA